MANPRVHEIASDLGVESKVVLLMLRDLGEYVKGPSSSIKPPVARKVRQALVDGGVARPVLPALHEHGVEALTYATSMPRRLPDLIDLLSRDHDPAEPISNTIAAAAKDRAFFFVPARAADAVARAEARITNPPSLKIPTPTGVLVMAQPAPDDTPNLELIAWNLQGDELQLISCTLRAAGAKPRLVSTGVRYQAMQLATPLVNNKGVRRLASVWDVIPDRKPSLLSAGDRRSQTTSEASDSSSEPSIVYATRSTFGLGTASDYAPAPRMGRWAVRGHWRNQWHPSTNDHKRIWIEDHTAGAAEGELKHRDRVYMIAPRVAG